MLPKIAATIAVKRKVASFGLRDFRPINFLLKNIISQVNENAKKIEG